MTTAVHQYEDKLLEFAYGELPANEQQAVEAHLRGCTKCTDALAEIRKVRSVMQALPAVGAPDAGLESLLAYAEQTAKRNAEASRPARSPWSRWIMLLSSAAALVVAGVVAFRAAQDFEPKEAAAAMAQQSLADQDAAKKQEQAKAVAKRDEPQAAPEKAAAEALAAAPSPVPAPAAAGPAATPRANERFKEAENKRGLDNLPTKDARPAEEEYAAQRESRSRREADYGAGNAMEPRTVVAPAPKPAPSKKAAVNSLDDAFGGGDLEKQAAAPVEQKVAPASVPLPVAGSVPLTKAPAKPTAQPPPPPSPAVAAAPEPPPAAARAPEGSASFGLGSSAGTGVGGGKPSLALGGKGGARADAPADEDAPALSETADKISADRKKNVSESLAKLKLEEAAAAAARGDTAREVALAIEVLRTTNPTGALRLDALTRACQGLERLGDSAGADAYCDALLSEYPSSVAASRLAQQRGMQQRVPAAKAKKAPAKVDSAPAQAY